MKKLVACLLLSSIVILLPGCLYGHFKTPLDTNLEKTQLGAKVGESTATSILWLFAWGDAGTRAAAEQGGIKTLNHADQEVLIILFGLYYKHTTIVYGD